ncbi:Nucleolar Complex 2 protein, partial [Clydaea vesicula]
STKKFIRTKLKDTLDKRRKGKVVKDQKLKQQQKKLGKRNFEEEEKSDSEIDDASDEEELLEDNLDETQNSESEMSDNIEDLEIEDFSEDSSDEEDSDEETDEQTKENHKVELMALKEKDPEFFKYLQENDQELLNFGSSDEEDTAAQEEENQDSDVEEDTDNKVVDMEVLDEEGEATISNQITLSKDLINKWKRLLSEKNSLRALKKLLMAFRSAANFSDSDKEGEFFTYKIPNSSVFNAVIIATVKYAPIVLDFHLMECDGNRFKGLPSQSKKWKKLQPLTKSFLTNLIKLYKTLTDPTMVKFVMKESTSGEFHGSTQFFQCFPKLIKEYVKVLVGFWSRIDNSNKTEELSVEKTNFEQLQLVSFLGLRKICVINASFVELVLKLSYSAYISTASKTNSLNLKSIKFLLTSLTELELLSPPQSLYSHAFTNIRKLAIILRQAITAKSPEAVKKVYSWSFLWGCRLWANVVAGGVEGFVGGKESILKPLIYPLVQVILGAMRIRTSSKYFPHRLHCIKLVIDIESRTKTFIPVCSYLFDIFDSVEITKLGKASTNKKFDFESNVRTQKEYLGTKVFQTGVVEETIDLLFEYFGIQALKISFPELVLPALFQLKRFQKTNKSNFALTKNLNLLIEKLELNQSFILEKRSDVDFSPKDLNAANAFLSTIKSSESPLLKYLENRRKVQKSLMI